MFKIKLLTSPLLIILLNNSLFSQDSLMNILSEEITREKEGLATQTTPPYYIDYRVDDINSVVLSTSFGSLVGQNEDNDRVLTCTVKVGNYNFDNSHDIAGTGSISQPFVTRLPFENSADAIKMTLWQATHSAYRSAVDAMNQVQSGMKSESKISKSDDFSIEKPQVYFESQINYKFRNRDEWINRLKKYSEPFLLDEKVISADAILSSISVRKYFISSEGSKIVQNSSYCQLQVIAISKAEDGSSVPAFRSYYTFSPEELPSDKVILKEVYEMIDQLKKLRNAPIAEAYSGPAILSCSAAAVFFHEIFGHRIEGQRMKSDFDSQTFKSKVNDYILPKFISVISDPTLTKFAGQDMFGYYKYDDQGVETQKVIVVNNGILQNFLMSRSPIEGFSNSNGHGRAKAGMAPVSRQSNLIVETKKPITNKELRKKLISQCKKEHKEYGYMFDQVVGGFTMTNRYSPNVFNVSPTVVYKIFVDGRSDELVRGVNFIGTPLAIFSEIEATGDSTGVFTGYCGAESGSIPVTATSPALFIKKIETQKQPEGFGQMPILPRPDIEKLNK